MTRLYTMGFTKKSAADFFGTLQTAGVRRLVDVRLNNVSQLAGFTKRDDLRYFLREIVGIEYVHLPELAPTADLLRSYRGGATDWPAYEAAFRALIRERRIEDTVPRDVLDESCLLCSEATPHHCHRRVVAEYLRDAWGDTTIEHLR